MAEEQLPKFTEDDDMTRARAFWKENGRSIIFGILLGLAGIAGFNYWNVYQQKQGESASILYEEIIAQTSESEDAALQAGLELKENFSATVYAVLGAFHLAKLHVQNDNLPEAENELRWALSNSNDNALSHLARLRLAAVLLSSDKADEALELLNVADMSTFEVRYQELLGDAYLKQGNRSLAKTAYEKSLSITNEEGMDPTVIQLKLDNIGES